MSRTFLHRSSTTPGPSVPNEFLARLMRHFPQLLCARPVLIFPGRSIQFGKRNHLAFQHPFHAIELKGTKSALIRQLVHPLPAQPQDGGRRRHGKQTAPQFYNPHKLLNVIKNPLFCLGPFNSRSNSCSRCSCRHEGIVTTPLVRCQAGSWANIARLIHLVNSPFAFTCLSCCLLAQGPSRMPTRRTLTPKRGWSCRLCRQHRAQGTPHEAGFKSDTTRADHARKVVAG